MLPYVLTLGETMGLFSGSRVGSFAHIGQTEIGVGGAESNVAVGLTRLGVNASWIGRIGDDSIGNRVVREIRGEGVDVRATIDPEALTGLMLKEFRGRGTSQVRYYRADSAGSRIHPIDVVPELVENATVIHLTGITPLLSASARATCIEAAERARGAGVRVSLDINYRSSLAPVETASEIIGELAELADIVFGSQQEISLVAPSDVPSEVSNGSESESLRALARALDPNGKKEVVLKLGERGAATVTADAFYASAGHRVDVVDTVGAGDAFVAGYLSGDVQNWSIEQKLTRANACGALMCTVPGDWEASPTTAELDAFLDFGADPVSR
jgi:2-dehydro-3-deoxygluconokinase